MKIPKKAYTIEFKELATKRVNLDNSVGSVQVIERKEKNGTSLSDI